MAQYYKSVAVSNPNDPSVSSTVNFNGFTVTTSGTLAVNSGVVSGSVSITATNSTTGTVLFAKTYAVSNLSVSSSCSCARFLLNVGVVPYSLSADVTVSQTGGVWSASVMITRQLDFAGHGAVDIIEISFIIYHYGADIGSARYDPKADFNGAGTINITDIGIVTLWYGAANYS